MNSHLVKYHCHKCGAWLFSYDEDCIKEGKQLEIKCRSCGAMNYLLPQATRMPITFPLVVGQFD